MNKPKVQLLGRDSNIFNLVGIASKELKRFGMDEKAKEMSGRVFKSGSYHDALKIISEYCEIS